MSGKWSATAGPRGCCFAESIFEADSDAVLAMVEMLEGDEGANVRWRLALRGADMLLTDLGLEGDEPHAHAAGMKESFGRDSAAARACACSSTRSSAGRTEPRPAARSGGR